MDVAGAPSPERTTLQPREGAGITFEKGMGARCGVSAIWYRFP